MNSGVMLRGAAAEIATVWPARRLNSRSDMPVFRHALCPGHCRIEAPPASARFGEDRSRHIESDDHHHDGAHTPAIRRNVCAIGIPPELETQRHTTRLCF